MKIGLDLGAAMTAALDAARDAEVMAARTARRAEAAFEHARVHGAADVQAAAERFRAAHRVHMGARDEVAEIEAAMTEEALAA